MQTILEAILALICFTIVGAVTALAFI